MTESRIRNCDSRDCADDGHDIDWTPSADECHVYCLSGCGTVWLPSEDEVLDL